MLRRASYLNIIILGFLLILHYCTAQTVTPKMTLEATGSGDQDDMCIWIHPVDPARSTIIGSDKDKNKLFVYDLNGDVIQTVSVSGKPGNIDMRYGFLMEGQRVDIIGYNDRDNDKICIYTVDPSTRELTKADDGAIDSGSNYGFSLYHSPQSGKFYAFTGDKIGNIKQIELYANEGKISGTQVRAWDIGDQTEGIVCDDETGKVYFGEEEQGIWKIGAEPEDPTTGVLIARTGDDSDLTADVEGVTLYYAADGEGYILASSQGSDNFKVYDRKAPHEYIKTFSVSGASSTDGIDVTNMNLGAAFPGGIFCAHSGGAAIKVCDYTDLGLAVDTLYWDPRPEETGTRVESTGIGIAQKFTLCQNYPNPFNPNTNIEYSLHEPGHVKIQIFNLRGQVSYNLVDEFQHAGVYNYTWEAIDTDGMELPAGIYLYNFRFGDYSRTVKMLLLK